MLNGRQAGFNIIEIMISLVVLGVLIALGAPGFAEFLQNQQIRAAAESTLNGLQVARAEAVRSNGPVRFQFVSDLTSGCVLTNGANIPLNWVVSQGDPTSKCDQQANPADPTNPQIVQSRSAAEGTPNALANALFFPSLPAAQAPQPASTVTFSSLGNTVANADATPSLVRVDVTNASMSPTAMRALRIVVNPGGSTRMCDPAVALPDPRGCPAWP